MFGKFLLIIFGLMLVAGCGNRPSRLPVVEIPPTGWKVLAMTENDLNGDGLIDEVLAIEKIPEKNNPIADDQPRKLLVLLKNKDKQFTLASANENAILCRTCGGAMGDPFLELSSKKNQFSITHYGGSRDRWGYTHFFQFLDGDWRLTDEIILTGDSNLSTAKEEAIDLTNGKTVINYTIPFDYQNNPDLDDSAKREIVAVWDRPEETKIKPIKPLIRFADFNINEQIINSD